MAQAARAARALSPRTARVLAALWYCTYWAGLAAIQPFFTVFWQSQGLSDIQIGVLAAARQWVSVPASFAVSAAADRLHAHRTVLLAALVASTLARLALNWAPSFAASLALVLVGQFFTAPVTVLADTIVSSSAAVDGDYGRIRAWGAAGWGAFSAPAGALIARWGYVAGFVASALLTLPCAPATLAFKFTSKEELARQRLRAAEAKAAKAASELEEHSAAATGAAAAAGTGAAAGKVAATDEGKEDSRPAAAPVAAPAADAHVCIFADADAKALAAAAKAAADAAVLKLRADADALAAAAALPFAAKLRALLSRLDVWLHLWNATLQGLGLGLYQSYLFLTLKRMGASTTLMGLTVTVDCLAEFPALFFLDRALKYVPLSAMLHLSVVGYAARLALYAWLPSWPSPWLVLPVQLLHGLTYAWGWGAGTVRGNALAPPGLQATIQGLFQGAYLGAGAGLGSVLGGWLLAALGERRMWAVSAVAILAGWALHFAVVGAAKGVAAARRRRRRRGQQQQQAQTVPRATS